MLVDTFGSLRVFEVDNAREALILLDEMLVDAVVALGDGDDGAWASFIRRWMAGKPGLCDIPFSMAANAEDCRALRRMLDEPTAGYTATGAAICGCGS